MGCIDFWHINKNYFYISTVFLQEEKNNEEMMWHRDANRHKSLSGPFKIFSEAAGWCPAVLDKSLSNTTQLQNIIFLPCSLCKFCATAFLRFLF